MPEQNLIKAKFRPGDKCICKNENAFRTGQPFTILSIAIMPCKSVDGKRNFRYVYICCFDDDVIDSIAVEEGGYEIEMYKSCGNCNNPHVEPEYCEECQRLGKEYWSNTRHDPKDD